MATWRVDAAVTVNATQPDARTGSLATRRNGVVTFTRSGDSTAAPLNIYFTVERHRASKASSIARSRRRW